MSPISKTDWLILFLKKHPLDRIRLMKALFLFWHRRHRSIPGFFEFEPYLYGPFSLEVYDALDSAQSERLVVQVPPGESRRARYFLTKKGGARVRSILNELDKGELDEIGQITDEVASLGFNELLRRVYKEAPEYATESVWREEP